MEDQIQKIIIIGANDLSENKVTVKDMNSGNQELIDIDNLLSSSIPLVNYYQQEVINRMNFSTGAIIGLIALFSATQNTELAEFKKQVQWLLISIPFLILAIGLGTFLFTKIIFFII